MWEWPEFRSAVFARGMAWFCKQTRSLALIAPESRNQPTFEIPKHWARIGGIDIGWDHPTAAVELAHDRDADCVYVVNYYRARQQSVADHAGALIPWGRWLPWAWPHDAFQHDKGSGQQIAQLYRMHGLNMLNEHASFADDRGNGVEAGLFDMLDRMHTSRLKVFASEGWDRRKGAR